MLEITPGEQSSAVFQNCIDRLHVGDESARTQLIEAASARLRILARQLLADDRVRRWEDTDDVLQEALVTLHRSLQSVRPSTTREFLGLAAFHIRRALIGLARHYYGPQGIAANHATPRLERRESSMTGLDRPANGTAPEFALSAEEERLQLFQVVDELDDEDREITQLLWLHGLTQHQTAQLLEITERTVRRRWQRARLQLFQRLRDHEE